MAALASTVEGAIISSPSSTTLFIAVQWVLWRIFLTPQLCIQKWVIGVILFEFRRDLWCLKTVITGLSCGIICVILRLALLVQYQSVTHTHTHTHRQTHDNGNTGLAYCRVVIRDGGRQNGTYSYSFLPGYIDSNGLQVCLKIKFAVRYWWVD